MRTRSVLVYTILRLLAFVVPFGILMIFPIFRQLPWLAAVFAALIGLSLSMLFLRGPRDAVVTGLSEHRARRTTRTDAEQDADIEDAANAAARGEAPDGE